MKRRSRSSWDSNISNRRQATGNRMWLPCVACCLSLAAGVLTGCESLQRKFTRKPKRPVALPSPIISFQDYSRAMTPLDRYRKHYMMFDYWNDELIESLQSPPVNPKRFRRASSEALAELETMRDLMVEEASAKLEPLIEERQQLNTQLHSPAFNASSSLALVRTLEAQTRAIARDFFWRDVQEQVKASPSSDAPAP